ncbi:peptidase domain-containing ABC transporter [Bordetella sp. 15P40C-2]|uniref:peptidase domain-containing ABC transporter n=1 Tax=Bordetella sp. 15P40C-2 TaxID=2572246 RepID=UPI00132861EE|nr:peptidase domain-containing ABC transporter [Bordetella sp. 15P40C-2]MVW72574.1 ATP-binding cassette domain-containing protein [Bordetella sp. 15P40C-2]
MSGFTLTDLKRLMSGRASVPVILQGEAAECANACIAMVASYHGHALTIHQLRQRFPISLKGATLLQVAGMCERLGMQYRAVSLELDELTNLRTPCILHWRFNHFVVLCSANGRTAIINDPATGQRKISYEELNEAFTGVALEVWPAETFQPAPPEPPLHLRKLIGKVYGIKRALLQIIVLALVLEMLSLTTPVFTQWVIDDVIVSADTDLLTTLLIGFALLLIMQTAVSTLRAYIGMQLGTSLSFQSKRNLFSHLVKLPTAYFERRHIGDIVSRFGSIDTIQQTLNASLVAGILDGLMTVITLALMLLYSWQLSLIAIAAMVIYGIVRLVSFPPLKARSHDAIIKGAQTQSHFLETLRGIRTLQVFQKTQDRCTSWQSLLVNQVNAGVKVQKLKLAFQQLNAVIFGMEGLIILWAGANLVISGGFSVGMLMAFLAYKSQFNQRVGALIDNFFELRMLRLQGERLSDIVLTAPESPGLDPQRPVDNLAGTLAFSNVSFRYGEAEPLVLDQASFQIEEGESVAIVGTTGTGKSTLLKLMLGILPPTQGEVAIGGVSYSQLGARGIRSISASVLQDDVLFAGSIADNVSFFDHEADREWIETCCKHAAIHDDIAALPMGYHTLVGDMGTVLSGGQKQRLLIARALYRRPKILILDEATCHLDLQVEARVVDMLRSLNLTRIVVAHRPQTIASADRILVLQHGRLHEHKITPEHHG